MLNTNKMICGVILYPKYLMMGHKTVTSLCIMRYETWRASVPHHAFRGSSEL